MFIPAFVFSEVTLERITDCYGHLVCMADGLTGRIERMNSREFEVIILPPGGKYAIDTRGSYTELVRTDAGCFLVNSFPN